MSDHQRKKGPKPYGNEISPREQEIIDQVYKGYSNKKIADVLFVTEKTVKFHLTNIYKKCGLRSRAELIVREIERKQTTTGEKPGVILTVVPSALPPGTNDETD